MNKQTKRNTRNKIKNKTKKYYGGDDGGNDIGKRRGIFDVIGNTLSQYTGKATEYVIDKGLRLAGLQKIKSVPANENTNTNNDTDTNTNNDTDTNTDNNTNNDTNTNNNTNTNTDKDNDTNTNNNTNNDTNNNEVNSTLSSSLAKDFKEIGSDIVNIVDKGSAEVIGNINDVLHSPKVGETVSQAAQETAEIGKNLLENFNEKVSTPEFKEETKKAIENAADYIEIAVKAMNEPVNDAIDELNKSAVKAASGVGSGLVKVGTDVMAAVPGFGAIIEVGKIMNDSSSAIANVVEATSDATSTISKAVEETSKNINEGIDNLNENKKTATQISNRTNKSIETFENSSNIKGGRKTKRKLLKHKPMSKRVRFAI